MIILQSQTLSRLAAAHRGAVRALQTFVSHAPLQPKVGHGLPPMYQELSALVRQLSLLAAQLHVGGEDSGNELKRMEDKENKVGKILCLHDDEYQSVHLLSCLLIFVSSCCTSLIVNYSINQILFYKSEKEEPVLKTEEISEKPSAFIQEVAGRKPQDSDKVPTPMKPGLKMKRQ